MPIADTKAIMDGIYKDQAGLAATLDDPNQISILLPAGTSLVALRNVNHPSWFRNAVRHLSLSGKTYLRGLHGHGLTASEAAHHMGISLSRVHAWWRRWGLLAAGR